MKRAWISGFCNTGNHDSCRGEYKNARPGGQSAYCAHEFHVYPEDDDAEVQEDPVLAGA